MRLRRVGPPMDDFGRRMAVDGPMELVLDGRVEGLRDLGLGVVINAGGVDVRDLLVKAALGGPDVPDTLDELIEVILTQRQAFLQAPVVQDEPFDQILLQPGGGPLPKPGALAGAHPVTHGENSREIVVIYSATDLPCALGLNY